jgi:general secretion pathway protein N
MAIWRMSRLSVRGGKLLAPMLTCGQVAGSRTKTGRALSWLIGIVLLGSIVGFNEMRAAAQTSLLDDNAPMAHTTALSPFSSPPAAYDTARQRIGVRGAGQDTGAEQQRQDATPREALDLEAPAPGNPLWRLPLKQLSATRERPIFSPSRRPPPPAPAYVVPVALKQPAKPREPERPTIALAGTIIGTDGYRGAVFRDTSSQDVLRLRVGENYHGWVLLLITPREARLVKNGEQALLELPASTPAPARSSMDIMLDQVWAIGAD